MLTPSFELQFRGRADELAQVSCALRTLASGVPVRQLIVGEEGIGKSRLLAEALSSPETHGIVVRSGRAAELEADRPFGVLSDALGLRRDAHDPECAAIGGLIADPRLFDQAEQRHELMVRIAAMIKRESQLVPLALVLEDMHWADRFSAMTLIRVVHECEERPVGIFLTRRMLPLRAPIDELLERGRPRFERVDLDALDSEVMALLAHERLGAAPGPRLRQLIARSGGNPRLLLALIGALGQDRELRVEGDTVESATYTPPTSMRPAVMRRFSRLSDRCQDVLTVAAVFERPFGVATLAAICQRSVVDVLGDLREAIAARLLLEVAGVLSFRHELVRMIVYEETPVAVVTELHRQIGDVLRASGGSPAVVSHHVLRAAELSVGDVVPWPADEKTQARLRWELLTRAESEVALLVAHGLSNKQAGVRLQVSARTVETHLAHVFAKLRINSRVQLAAAVARAVSAPENGAERSRAADEAELFGTPQEQREQQGLGSA